MVALFTERQYPQYVYVISQFVQFFRTNKGEVFKSVFERVATIVMQKCNTPDLMLHECDLTKEMLYFGDIMAEAYPECIYSANVFVPFYTWALIGTKLKVWNISISFSFLFFSSSFFFKDLSKLQLNFTSSSVFTFMNITFSGLLQYSSNQYLYFALYLCLYIYLLKIHLKPKSFIHCLGSREFRNSNTLLCWSAQFRKRAKILQRITPIPHRRSTRFASHQGAHKEHHRRPTSFMLWRNQVSKKKIL